MANTNLGADPPAAANGGTVHVIATSLEGTREALDAATALARGICGSVTLFLRTSSSAPDLSDQDDNGDKTVDALKRLTHSYTPRPKVLSCLYTNPIDVVQLFQSPGLVVIGGEMRWWWPSAEQRLAHALTRLGCHVTFVHVPRSRFVPPLVAAARERARKALDVHV